MTTKRGFAVLCALVTCALAGCSCGTDADPMAMPDVVIYIDGGADVPVDAGHDAPPDRDRSCATGSPCSPDRGCRAGTCMAERTYAIGGPRDPITSYPPGEDEPVPAALWRGGYCTTAEVGFVDAPGGCDPSDETSCGDPACAACLAVGQQDGRDLSVCLRACIASLTESPCPGTGNTCLLGTGVCFPGCGSDDECRVQRRDTDGDGEIDPYDPTTNPAGDRLVYDDSTNATCNTVTWRCEHDGLPAAQAGDSCAHDFECEANGDCITASAWADSSGARGYCTKFGCETPGNDCAGGGVCQRRRIGVDLCVAPCTVGAEADADGEPGPDSAWVTNAGVLGASGGSPACRGGHACAWNGVDGAGVVGNGACVPGEYNDVTAPNVGAPCADDEACWSPFGAGTCLGGGVWSPSNYCSVLDCGAPGMPTDACGPATQCVTLFDDVTACLAECPDAEACSPGYACVEYDGDPSTPRVCFPVCVADADCRSGESCTIPIGDATGTCTP